MSRVFSEVTGKYILGGRNNRVRAERRDGTSHAVSAIEFRIAGPWAAGRWGKAGPLEFACKAPFLPP